MRDTKRIIVMTSGGDAPGMNASIRGVFRIVKNRFGEEHQVIGVRRGFQGLMRLATERRWATKAGLRAILVGQQAIMPERDKRPAFLLDDNAVRGILKTGGTILGTARCDRFRTDQALRARIRYYLRRKLRVTGAVVIGGDGSCKGALDLHSEQSPDRLPDTKLRHYRVGPATVAIPASIDNDIACTDFSLGADTARNTIVSAISNITDTADATHRTFILTVMGRNSGYLALSSALAAGAQFALIPEDKPLTVDKIRAIIAEIQSQYDKGRRHCIIVLAEGTKFARQPAGTAEGHLKFLLETHAKQDLDPRITELGHVQRGGMPTAFDRELAFRFAEAAVEELFRPEREKKGGGQKLAGCAVYAAGNVRLRPLCDVVAKTVKNQGRMPARQRSQLRRLHNDLNALR